MTPSSALGSGQRAGHSQRTTTADWPRGSTRGGALAASAVGLSEPSCGWTPENSLLTTVHELRDVLNLDPGGRPRPNAPTPP